MHFQTKHRTAFYYLKMKPKGPVHSQEHKLEDNFSSIIIDTNHLKLSVSVSPHWSTNSKKEMVVNLKKYIFKILWFISKNLLQWNKHYFAKTIFLPFEITCTYIYVRVYIPVCMYTYLHRLSVEICVRIHEIYGTIVKRVLLFFTIPASSSLLKVGALLILLYLASFLHFSINLYTIRLNKSLANWLNDDIL